jgi:hypothetical protein
MQIRMQQDMTVRFSDLLTPDDISDDIRAARAKITVM